MRHRSIEESWYQQNSQSREMQNVPKDLVRVAHQIDKRLELFKTRRKTLRILQCNAGEGKLISVHTFCTCKYMATTCPMYLFLLEDLVSDIDHGVDVYRHLDWTPPSWSIFATTLLRQKMTNKNLHPHKNILIL